MRYRIRTYVGATPMLDRDVTTGSARIMAEECRDRAARYGWSDVGMIEQGERPMRGEEIKRYLDRHWPAPDGDRGRRV